MTPQADVAVQKLGPGTVLAGANLGYVIIVTSLQRDFLPSSWGDYSATRWDFMTFFGTIGLFVALLFLFIRFLPMISIFEMRTMVPEAKIKEMN